MARNLRIPGPTPLPPAVLAAMQGEMIPHRGSEFKALYTNILSMAREAHRTDGDVFTWAASGSAGWEVAVVNLFSPGDPVLATVCGDFGERFAAVAKAFGLDVRRLDVPWGRAITPALLREALNANPEVKAVLLAHNETSTGVTNPLPELARIVRDHGALVIVDSVSGVGGIPLEMDTWGVDFVLSGSQKAWMCPPGLLVVAVGPRAWEAAERATFPKFYWDLGSARKSAAQGMTPTTPPLTLLYGFNAALEQILGDGLEIVWERHRRWGELTRAGVAELGLPLFADPAYLSNTVTAIALPDDLPAKGIVKAVRERFNIDVGAGQGALADAMLRIGHMGYCDEAALRETLAALGAVLAEQGRQPVEAEVVAAS